MSRFIVTHGDSNKKERERVACLLAGLETPDDLTELELLYHGDDLIEYLETRYRDLTKQCDS